MQKLQPGTFHYGIINHKTIFILVETVHKQSKIAPWKRCYKQLEQIKFVIPLRTTLQ